MPKTWWLITIIAVNFLALLACETEVQKIRQSNKAAQESQEARDASAGILSLQTPDSLSTPEAFLEPIPTSTPEPSPTPRPTATPVPSPTPVLSAKISSFDLRDGDCFNWRGGDPIQTGVDIYDVELVPCSGDWGQRILNSFVVDRNGNYPGDDLFDRLAFENCDRRYNKTILPTRESWESGDRTISCVQDSYGLANSDSQVLDRLVHELHLLKGDCFNDPPIQFEANSVEVVSCRGEWEFKVLDILIIESDIGFPTDADFSKLIFNKCDRRYTTTFSPTRDSWSIGDNEILCVQESFGLSELNPNRLDRLVDPASLMAGECFVKDLAMVNVEIVSCFGDWEQKVLSSFKIDLEGEYPGEDYIFGLGDDRCEPSANIILQPSNETWQFGDRTIFCLQKLLAPTATPVGLPDTTVSQASVLPPTPRPVIKLTHVIETIYYPVNGITTEEIFASVKANGLESLHQAEDIYTIGLAEFEPLLAYTLEGNYPCVLSSATLAINFTVTLPRHANTIALSAWQQDRWNQFAADVALHEQAHVDISLATMKEFTEVAPNSAQNCDQLESQLDTAFGRAAEIEDVRQDAFHADELARSNAARAPLQSQLADAETELARLDTRIAGLSAQIDALGIEITRIERPYRFSGIPAAIYDEYERTINQHNALIKDSNALTNSYNAVMEKINRIIEELAWTHS